MTGAHIAFFDAPSMDVIYSVQVPNGESRSSGYVFRELNPLVGAV